ncbi:2-oxo-4-hydroxy-4-carboxy-5-ureidoimidazoline decarboxylase [Streptomyces sp. NPDC002851]
MDRFNQLPASHAEAALLRCCAGHDWAGRLAAHRPYPDLDALLAAADEASYDLGPDELTQALAAERPHGPRPETTPPAALTALRAAHSAYEARFGHVFVIALDGYLPDEHLDQTLAGLRARLGNEPDDERALAADELRRIARARLTRFITELAEDPAAPAEPAEPANPAQHARDIRDVPDVPDPSPAGSPYVPV